MSLRPLPLLNLDPLLLRSPPKKLSASPFLQTSDSATNLGNSVLLVEIKGLLSALLEGFTVVCKKCKVESKITLCESLDAKQGLLFMLFFSSGTRVSILPESNILG